MWIQSGQCRWLEDRTQQSHRLLPQPAASRTDTEHPRSRSNYPVRFTRAVSAPALNNASQCLGRFPEAVGST
jgi:hypothetical protein